MYSEISMSTTDYGTFVASNIAGPDGGGTHSGCDAQNSDSSACNALPGCSHDDTLCVSECSTLSQNDC